MTSVPQQLPPFPSQSLDAAAQVAIDAHVGLRASVATIVNAEAHLSATAFLTADASVISPLKPTLATSALIIPEQRVNEGVLIKSTSVIWLEIIDQWAMDWGLAYKLTATQWEELVAGAFKKAGYDEVILTPRSGDYGRDVIAVKYGVGCVKIIGSVKAYARGNLVPYDAVRALLGVMEGEKDVSKGIITATSDFPPRIKEDRFIAPFLPTRLELMNGKQLQQWLTELGQKKN
jgi:restriction system protein